LAIFWHLSANGRSSTASLYELAKELPLLASKGAHPWQIFRHRQIVAELDDRLLTVWMAMDEKSIERELEKLFKSAQKIEAEDKKSFLDKKQAEKVAAGREIDTFSESFRKAEQKSAVVAKGDQTAAKVLRKDGNKVWNDPSLAEWPEGDYRIHVRNLPADATDRDLTEAFSHYKSFARAKVIFDSSGRNRRYGFVSLLDMNDYIDAMKTKNNSFVKSRRVILTPSKWKDKNIANAS
jgi:hypothetical protein